MIITTTSIAFVLLSLGLAICAWRFWIAFKKGSQTKKLGFLISLYFGTFAFQNGILGFGTLFFADKSEYLFFVLLLGNLFLVLPCVIGTYTIFYIFLPKKSPLPLIILSIILIVMSIIITVTTRPQPFITPQNGIDWDVPFSLSLTIFYLLFISIGSSFYIFLRLFNIVHNREIKILSFILALLAAIGVLDAFIRFVLLHSANSAIRANIYDVGISLIGMIFVSSFLLLPIIRKGKWK